MTEIILKEIKYIDKNDKLVGTSFISVNDRSIDICAKHYNATTKTAKIQALKDGGHSVEDIAKMDTEGMIKDD